MAEQNPEFWKNAQQNLNENNENKETVSALRQITSKLGSVDEGLKSGFDKVSGVFGDAFSPLSELKDLTVGTFEMLQGGFQHLMGAFSFLRGGTPEDKKQIGLLGQIKKSIQNLVTTEEEQLQLSEAEYKRNLRQDKTQEDGGGISEFIGIITGGLLVGASAFASNLGNSIGLMYKPFVNVFKGTFGKLGKSFSGIFSETGAIGKYITRIKTWFTAIGSRIKAWFKPVRALMKHSGVFGSIMGKIGSLFGKLLMPLFVVYEIIKGFMDEGTIRDKILSASAGVLSLWTQIPEWIVNGILAMFGSGFRVDFGKEEIIKAVNRISDWVFEYITWPVMNFLTNTLPNWFNKIGDFFTKTIPNFFRNMWKDIKDFFTKTIPNFFTKIGNSIKNVFVNFFKNIGDFFTKTIPNFFRNLIPSSDMIKSAFGSIINKLNPLNWFGDEGFEWINDLIPSMDDIKKFFKGFLDKLNPLNWFSKDEDESEDTKDGNLNVYTPKGVAVQGSFKRGGLVPETGVYRLHKDEYVVKKSVADQLGPDLNNLDKLKFEADRKEKDRQRKFEEDNKRIQKKLEKSLVNIDSNTRGVNQTQTTKTESTPKIQNEPPDEIESLALLVFNKSWGIT